MHPAPLVNSTPIHHVVRQDASGDAAMVVGYLGLAGWLAASAALAFLARRRSAAGGLGNLAHRLAVYAFLLAFLYPLATLNRFVWARPGDGECSVALSLVALNALTWSTALVEVIAYYLRYDGAPPHWTSYDTLTFAITTLVLAFSVSSLADLATRFVSVILVVPIAGLLVLAATLEAGETRAIHVGAMPYGWRTFSRPRRVFALLAGVGVYAFVVELLSPALTCALSIGVASVLMAVEHIALGALLTYVAYGDSSSAPPPTSVPSTDAAIAASASITHTSLLDDAGSVPAWEAV